MFASGLSYCPGAQTRRGVIRHDGLVITCLTISLVVLALKALASIAVYITNIFCISVDFHDCKARLAFPYHSEVPIISRVARWEPKFSKLVFRASCWGHFDTDVTRRAAVTSTTSPKLRGQKFSRRIESSEVCVRNPQCSRAIYCLRAICCSQAICCLQSLASAHWVHQN